MQQKLYVESQNLRVGNKFQNNNLPSSFYENDKNVGTTGLRSKIKLLKIRKKWNWVFLRKSSTSVDLTSKTHIFHSPFWKNYLSSCFSVCNWLLVLNLFSHLVVTNNLMIQALLYSSSKWSHQSTERSKSVFQSHTSRKWKCWHSILSSLVVKSMVFIMPYHYSCCSSY